MAKAKGWKMLREVFKKRRKKILVGRRDVRRGGIKSRKYLNREWEDRSKEKGRRGGREGSRDLRTGAEEEEGDKVKEKWEERGGRGRRDMEGGEEDERSERTVVEGKG